MNIATNIDRTQALRADVQAETAFARFMREQAEADNAKRAELAAFIAAHDDVLDGNMEHRGAAGWRYCLTVRIDDCFNTRGFGRTLADAYASAREGAAKTDAAMRDLIAPVVRAYVGDGVMGQREQALSELAAMDGEELAQDFYAFAHRRAAILHASSAWGFCSDAAIIQRLLDELQQAKAGAA